MRRFKGYFGDGEKATLLKAIGDCRNACLVARKNTLLSHKDVYEACDGVRKAIDDLAGVLTGNREHFWTKLHSSPPTGFRKPEEGA